MSRRTRRHAPALLLLAGLGAALATVAPRTTAARPRPSGQLRPFEANKTFGLGIMLGAPTGLSGKYYLGPTTAIDFGLGVYHRFRHHEAFQLHADFLWHPVVLASTEPFLLPLYFGVGARFLQHDDYDHRHDDDYDDEGSHLGVRVPIGILMDFNRIPIDVFFELALVVDLLADDHHGHVDFDGALGARYYF